MKRKNLEKAIILGLMAASISVPVWAAEISIDEFKDSAVDNVISVTEDTIVKSDVNNKNNSLKDYDIQINDGVNLELNNVKNNGLNIDGNGNVVINVEDFRDNSFANGNINAKSLTIAVNNSNSAAVGVSAVSKEETTITTSENIVIDVETSTGSMDGAQGILNKNGSININSDGDLIITAVNTVDKSMAASHAYGIDSYLENGPEGAGETIIDVEGVLRITAKGNDAYGISMVGDTGAVIDAKKGIFIEAHGNKLSDKPNEDDPWSKEVIGYNIDSVDGQLLSEGDISIRISNQDNHWDASRAINIYKHQIDDVMQNEIHGANVSVVAEGTDSEAMGIYHWSEGRLDREKDESILNVTADNSINVDVHSDNDSAWGVYAWGDNSYADSNLRAKNIFIKAQSDEGTNTVYGILAYNADISLEAENGINVINASGNSAYGVRIHKGEGCLDNVDYSLDITGDSNVIYGQKYATVASKEGIGLNINAVNGSNFIKSTDNRAVYTFEYADTNIIANNGFNYIVSEKNIAVDSRTGATTDIIANDSFNHIVSYGNRALYVIDSDVNISAKANVIGGTDIVKEELGAKHSIEASSKSQVNVSAHEGDNALYGVIYAKDEGTNVTLDHNITDEAGTVIKKGSGSNYIYSSTHGSSDTVGSRQNVVAALYAQNKGKIDITAGEGGINHIETSYTDLDDSETSTDSERTVWAQRGGKINIEGTTVIKSSNAEDFYDEEGYATNSRGVAITAGSGVALADPDHGYTDANGNKHAFFENGVLADVDKVLGYRSEVNLNYGAGSAIYGDIVSGYGGSVNISTTNENSGLYMEGNALAGNGGKLTLDIGKGGTWFGRADDYGDAGYGEDAQHKQNYYNPVFSDTIYTCGTVDIKMGEGSTWYLTGQSWVSSLDVTKGNGNVTIDMAKFNKGTHGLTISDLKGINGGDTDVTFVMDLDHNSHSTSDMLYIKSAEGEYDVVLNDVIDGMDKISEDNVLRFATVQGGASFNSVTLKDAGLYNLGFEVGHSEYDQTAETENKGYNGSAVDTNKPGNENVEGFFDLNKDSEDNTQKIMLMDNADAAADPDSVQNWYITKVLGEDISDGGKTVVNMSKVNYSNAVYMDRLNKRLGEARYINTEEDQGMWVRMRHDRIGKDNEFRIMNTMYELGYDEKQECDNGERRVGAAIDYMDGSSEYTGVGGSGDVSRKGIWLYDTWLGDKGHYSDFVAKWGHLSNDFTLYRGGDKITGDFSNNVYSISAEYGRKKDIGNNWYFEPQVQLQYARVTDANYTTSQGTEVSLDAINSLIARAGFRLGKDLGERSTVYFKADLLHEFLGDQDIYATDGTGTMDVTYGNEGTWCDIGFGFATAMSKTSYAYLDVETSLGNDYEETYQINAGLQWSF